MFYRVIAVCNFEKEEDAGDFFNDCLKAYGKSFTANSLKKNEEAPYIQLHRCFHDENPTLACEVLEQLPVALPWTSIDEKK